MSLLASIPAPTKELQNTEPEAPAAAPTRVNHVKEPPPYGQRKGFVPRKQEDYGGGGAFPEIHVAQYPLDMGRPDKRGASARGEQTLALSVNADGEINYDAVLRRGATSTSKAIVSSHKALIPKLDQINSEMPKPDDEEIQETAKATLAALSNRVDKKQAVMNPKNVPTAPGEAQYIKYTPANASTDHASGSSTRIIKMQDMPVDPLEPPKFRHMKVPRAPGSPPAPVMHSPPRALTAKDYQDWKIPPCVSNWKNAKGYTIPLDKRLAADGRGLQQVTINDGFAKFTEALYIAEQKARSAVEARSKMQRELLARDKERKEMELRDLAMKARMDRLGGGGAGGATIGQEAGSARTAPAHHREGRDGDDARDYYYDGDGGARERGPLSARDSGRAVDARRDYSDDNDEDIPREYRTRDERRQCGDDQDVQRRRDDEERDGRDAIRRGSGDARSEEESRQEREARLRRDEIRKERQRERERERRLESKDVHGYKRSKITRDKDRDISEKIALGMAKVTGGEAMYDQRLFNQDTGMDSGLGVDDAYNVYDKPLFADRSDIFKSRGGRHVEEEGGTHDDEGRGGGAGEVDTRRFKPDKGFSGVDYSNQGAEKSGGGPLQFERDPREEADPFGLDSFLSDVKSGKKKGVLDDIGKKGGMAAGGGGGGRSYEEYAGGGGRRMEFTSGGT